MSHKLTEIIADKLNSIICNTNNITTGQVYFLRYDGAKKVFSEADLNYMKGLNITVIVTDIGNGDTLTTFFFDDEMNKLMTVEAGE